MKVHIDDLRPSAIAGIKLAYRRSGRSRTEHFDEWIQRLMKQDRGATMDLQCLLEDMPVGGLSEAEWASILVAREFVRFAIMMIMAPSADDVPGWDITREDFDPTHPKPPAEEVLETLSSSEPAMDAQGDEISVALVKWLVVIGLHVASTYAKRERTFEMMLSRPDPEELNDLCQDALTSPALRLEHRKAIMVAYQAMQALLLLDRPSARAEAADALRGKVEMRNVRLGPDGAPTIAISELKWLVIRGIDLATGYLEDSKVPEGIYERIDPEELNDACEWGLVSIYLDPDDRHAIMIAYQAMQALLNLDISSARDVLLERLEMHLGEPVTA